MCKKITSLILVGLLIVGSFSACGNSVKAEWAKNEVGVFEGEIEGVDFVINIPEGKDIKILQLTDTQLCDPSKARNETRVSQLAGAYYADGITKFQLKTGGYIRPIVENVKPDLIVLTGDIVYGETDDSGEDLLKMIEHMDSYKIPWAATWGNHDNESAKGVKWQCEQLEKSEYCVFKRGNVTGNSNYNIVLRQGGEIKYIAYMLDTNGCREVDNPGEGIMPDNIDIAEIQQQAGIYPDQIQWFSDTNKTIANLAKKKTVESLVFFHIEPAQYYQACVEQYGYNDHMSKLDLTNPGDFGTLYDGVSPHGVDQSGDFFNAAKAAGTTGMFFGHEHDNDGSLVYDGIRLTFGSKTGTHTFYRAEQIGGTVITIGAKDNAMNVRHVKNIDL